jgi:hypothetical protein
MTRAKFATDFKTIAFGHQDIEDDQVIIINRSLVERGLSIRSDIDRVALLAQSLGDDVRHARLIFDQKNSHLGAQASCLRFAVILDGAFLDGTTAGKMPADRTQGMRRSYLIRNLNGII